MSWVRKRCDDIVRNHWQKAACRRIGNPEALPADYIRVRTSTEPNRVMIKDAIKAGMNVPGAELEERQSMRISFQKILSRYQLYLPDREQLETEFRRFMCSEEEAE